MTNNINNFNKILQDEDHFLLLTHVSPDGDAVGSTVALYEHLKSLGKMVKIASDSEVPKMFSYLKWTENFESDFLIGDFNVVILLDCGDLKRSGFADRILKSCDKIKIINIDHHIQNDIWKIANINLSDPTSPSTCQILYKIFVEQNIPISIDQATALLTGIYYDTGGFLHQNTDKNVFMATSHLLKLGARFKKIQQSVTKSRTPEMLKLWGLALSRMTVDKKLGLVISVISKDDLEKLNVTEDDLAGLVNVFSLAEEANASILIYETSDGKIKGSLRTEKNNIDVSKIANLLGGGGHHKASGFSIEGRLEKNNGRWRII